MFGRINQALAIPTSRGVPSISRYEGFNLNRSGNRCTPYQMTRLIIRTPILIIGKITTKITKLWYG
jgi:hypothetical protein